LLPNLIALQLRRKHPSPLLWAFWLTGNGLGLVLLFAVARYPTSLYVRHALFSEVFDAEQFRTENQLNAFLEQSLRHDPPQLKPRSLFTPTELINLDGLVQASQAANCRVPSDHPKTRLTAADCTARAIAKDVSPYMMGGKCTWIDRSRRGSARFAMEWGVARITTRPSCSGLKPWGCRPVRCTIWATQQPKFRACTPALDLD